MVTGRHANADIALVESRSINFQIEEPMALTFALIFLMVMLTLDCLYVATLLAVGRAPRFRKWS